MAYTPLGRGWAQPGLPPVPADTTATAPYCAAPESPAAPDEEAPAGPDSSAAAVDEPEMVDTLAAVTGLGLPDGCAVVEAALPGDTARAPLVLDLWILNGPEPVVELREAESAAVGGDGRVSGWTVPGATTTWLWAEGVRARVTGRRDGAVRLRLDGRTEAWVQVNEVGLLPDVAFPRRARVGTVRLSGAADRVQVRVSVSQPVP